MGIVSRGFRGRRRPSAELPPASTWSRTSRSCRPDPPPASTAGPGRAGLLGKPRVSQLRRSVAGAAVLGRL